MNLNLNATAGPDEGEAHCLANGFYVLGRSKQCGIHVLGDATVSRQHCLIEVTEDGVTIQDLGSLNGTFVNNERIGQRKPQENEMTTMMMADKFKLKDGDVVRLCSHVFTVRIINDLTIAAD